MRDAVDNLKQRNRNRRRAGLLAMLLVASPAVAQSPNNGRISIPPLPLNQSSQVQINPSIRVNPYCAQEGAQSGMTPVQLASGNPSAVRLKPIGAAIGLHPIDRSPNQPAKLRADGSQSPAMVVDAPASQIKTNPLVGSQHHTNKDLVDTSVDVANTATPFQPVRQPNVTPEAKSSIVLIRPTVQQPKPPVAATPVAAPASPNQGQAAVAPVAQRPNQASPIPAHSVSNTHRVATPAATQLPRAKVETTSASEPITFSFSDSSDSSLTEKSERTAESKKQSTTPPVTAAKSQPQGNLPAPIRPERLSEPSVAVELPASTPRSVLSRSAATPVAKPAGQAAKVVRQKPQIAKPVVSEPVELVQPVVIGDAPVEPPSDDEGLVPIQSASPKVVSASESKPSLIKADRQASVLAAPPVRLHQVGELERKAAPIKSAATDQTQLNKDKRGNLPEPVVIGGASEEAPLATTTKPAPRIAKPAPRIAKAAPSVAKAPHVDHHVAKNVSREPLASKAKPAASAKTPRVNKSSAPVVAEPTPAFAPVHTASPVMAGPLKSTEKTSERSLHQTRFRAPVAVTKLPLALERPAVDETASIVRPSISPVKALDLNQSNEGAKVIAEIDEDTKLTPLYMSRAQVRSLTLGGNVRRVEVADKNVCQAFAAGPNRLKLIGTGNGVTQLVVWAGANEKSPTQVRAFEIHVQDAVAATGKTVVDRSKMLNASIQKMFPGCRVNVQQVSDTLVVSGRCDNPESAKQIMRMVRKTVLVPVRDELTIAGR